jgi:hypothetical protein
VHLLVINNQLISGSYCVYPQGIQMCLFCQEIELYFHVLMYLSPITVSVLRRRFKAARLLGLRVPIPAGGTDVSLGIVVCCQVEVPASG